MRQKSTFGGCLIAASAVLWMIAVLGIGIEFVRLVTTSDQGESAPGTTLHLVDGHIVEEENPVPDSGPHGVVRFLLMLLVGLIFAALGTLFWIPGRHLIDRYARRLLEERIARRDSPSIPGDGDLGSAQE